jgi:hypothetical protein
LALAGGKTLPTAIAYCYCLFFHHAGVFLTALMFSGAFAIFFPAAVF